MQGRRNSGRACCQLCSQLSSTQLGPHANTETPSTRALGVGQPVERERSLWLGGSSRRGGEFETPKPNSAQSQRVPSFASRSKMQRQERGKRTEKALCRTQRSLSWARIRERMQSMLRTSSTPCPTFQANAACTYCKFYHLQYNNSFRLGWGRDGARAPCTLLIAAARGSGLRGQPAAYPFDGSLASGRPNRPRRAPWYCPMPCMVVFGRRWRLASGEGAAGLPLSSG